MKRRIEIKLRSIIIICMTVISLCLSGCREEDKSVTETEKRTEAVDKEKNPEEEKDQEEQELPNKNGNIKNSIEGYDISKLDKYMAEVEEKAFIIQKSLENDELSQTDMNMKSQELYELWDKALNYLWKELQNNLPEDQFEGLKEEQIRWISKKESEVKEAGQEFTGGSLHALVVNSEAARITKERVYILLSLLKDGRTS